MNRCASSCVNAHAEQAVQRAFELVAVVLAGLGELQRQIAVRTRLALVDQARARAIHRLDGVLFPVDLRRIHVLFVVVPVAGRFPQALVQDDRGIHLLVSVGVLHVHPVLHEGVLQTHAVGKPEREARAFVGHHEELHLAADATVVALLGLGDHALVLGELFLAAEGDAVDAREHLVVLVAFPIRARHGGQFERLERLGVADVRADAHVDVFALLIERDARVLRQVADVLDLVLLAAFLHERDRFGVRELEDAEFQVLLADLLHLGFDGGEVLFGDFRVGEVDVVVEPVIGGGTVAEVGFGIQALDRLRHDVGGGVAQDVELFVLGAFGDRSVVIQDLHGNSPCTYDAADGLLPACGAPPSAPRRGDGAQSQPDNDRTILSDLPQAWRNAFRSLRRVQIRKVRPGGAWHGRHAWCRSS